MSKRGKQLLQFFVIGDFAVHVFLKIFLLFNSVVT